MPAQGGKGRLTYTCITCAVEQCSRTPSVHCTFSRRVRGSSFNRLRSFLSFFPSFFLSFFLFFFLPSVSLSFFFLSFFFLALLTFQEGGGRRPLAGPCVCVCMRRPFFSTGGDSCVRECVRTRGERERGGGVGG